MSDFDAFEPVSNVEDHSDPAAEFLAREQNALGELDDDFEFPTNPKDISQKMNGNYENGDTNEFTTNEINGPNGLSNGDDDIDSDVMNMNAINSSQSSDKFREFREEIKEEPEKIKKWREEQNKLLEEKDREESRRKEELKETAKHELEEWYARYAEQLEKSKLNNRNAEKEWVAERDTEIAGQEWEKITKMCDFNPKSTRNTKDTSRMRSILLQLKQNPPSGQTSKQ